MEPEGRPGGHGFAGLSKVRTFGCRLTERPEGIQGTENQIYEAGVKPGLGSLIYHPSPESYCAKQCPGKGEVGEWRCRKELKPCIAVQRVGPPLGKGQPAGNECCMASGNGRRKAYTACIEAVLLNPEIAMPAPSC